MKKAWKFARELAAVDYSIKAATFLTGLWSGLTVFQLLLICLYVVLVPNGHWLQMTYMGVTLGISAAFLRASVGKLTRARARRDRADWVNSMLAQW